MWEFTENIASLASMDHTVNHDTLISKLFSYGVRGLPLEWVSSFLFFRKQYVSLQVSEKNCFREVKSDLSELDMGVPQGSVLGPMLFILYVNGLERDMGHAFFTMYADDLSLIVSNKNEENLADNCTTILHKLGDWFSQNQLFFNASKTQIVRFHNYQNICPLLEINFNDCAMKSNKNTVNFLGIRIDEHLSWKPHCQHVIGKLNSINFVLRNMKHVFDIQQLLSVYYALAESQIRYGICFWGNSTHCQSVFISQKRILRNVADVCTTHSCRDIFKKLKVLTLTSLYIFEICVYVFRNKSKFVLTKDFCMTNTRHGDDIYIPFVKYSVSLKSPDFLGPRIYNKLPNEIKISENLAIFRRILKKFLIEKCFYSLTEFFTF